MRKLNFSTIVWGLYALQLLFTITCLCIFPFKFPGEQIGFFISTSILFWVCYGVFALIAKWIQHIFQKQDWTKLLPEVQIKIKWVLLIFPAIAFYGAFDCLFIHFPIAIKAYHYLYFNTLNMGLGLLLGGFRLLSTRQNLIKK